VKATIAFYITGEPPAGKQAVSLLEPQKALVISLILSIIKRGLLQLFNFTSSDFIGVADPRMKQSVKYLVILVKNR
jgi:hypothetical protein